jgi:hypothetical protein
MNDEHKKLDAELQLTSELEAHQSKYFTFEEKSEKSP